MGKVSANRRPFVASVDREYLLGIVRVDLTQWDCWRQLPSKPAFVFVFDDTGGVAACKTKDAYQTVKAMYPHREAATGKWVIGRKKDKIYLVGEPKIYCSTAPRPDFEPPRRKWQRKPPDLTDTGFLP